MTRPPRPSWLLCASGLAILLLSTARAVPLQGDEKSIFVAVLDANRQPVAGLTGADFAVREDGVDREVVSAKLSTEPLQVVLLADTTGGAVRYVPTMRAGLQAFVDAVLAANPESQIALWEFGERPRRISSFTNDKAGLGKEIGQLFPRSRAGSMLLEAVRDTSEALARRPGRRRAIVALKVEPSAEQSELEPKAINDALVNSRAQLWTLSVQESTEQNSQRDALLTALQRNAGGLREVVLLDTGIEGQMRRIAAALTTQYELTYRRPSGRAKVVMTGLMRDGLTIVTGLAAPQ